MNTQEHIKNCKDCGNGFYCKGLDLCVKCQLKKGKGFTVSVDAETNARLLETQWTNAEIQAMVARNCNPLQFNQIKLEAEKIKESNRIMTKADLDKLSLRVHIYCAAIFAFILYMHIFKL
jgi:acetyl-CoA carboxylase beta subunit